jgi:hypothetical protein
MDPFQLCVAKLKPEPVPANGDRGGCWCACWVCWC